MSTTKTSRVEKEEALSLKSNRADDDDDDDDDDDAESRARARAERFRRARRGVGVRSVAVDARATGKDVRREGEGTTPVVSGERSARVALEEVTSEETFKAVGDERVANGVGAMALGRDGAVYVGREDGVVTRAGGGEATMYPDVSSDGTFVNAQTPVRMIQLSPDEDEALIGYRNGGWTKACVKTGLPLASSRPREEFADVFALVKSKKLSKYVDTAPNAKSMVASEDLTVLYLSSPVLRDHSIYVWNIENVETPSADSVVDDDDDDDDESSDDTFVFDETVLPKEQRRRLDDMDDIAAYDAWMKSVQESERPAACEWGSVERLEFHSDSVVALLRLGNILISGGADGYIAIWDVKGKSKAGNKKPLSNKPFYSTAVTSAVRLLTMSKDGRTLYCGCVDGTVRIYDVQGKRNQASLSYVRSVGGQEGMLCSLCVISTFVIAGSAKVNKESFIQGDGDVSVWRASDGALMSRWTQHQADVVVIVQSSDGKRFYTGDVKGKICKFSIRISQSGSSSDKRDEDRKQKSMRWRQGFLLS
jgi:WD40 repeat protein